MTPGDRLAGLAHLDRVIADPLRFKQRLRIGENAYALKRLARTAWSWWDSAGAASTGMTVARSAVVAGAFFAPAAPTGVMAWLGLAAPAVAVTPVGWVVAAAVLAGGGYYGVTRWWASQPDTAVDVIPRFINTPIDQLGAALFDQAGGLALLVALADGEMVPAERTAIGDHLVRDWGFDAAYVDAALPLLEAEFDADAVEASTRAMARFTAASPDCNGAQMQRELLAFLRELILADGRVDPREKAAIARIEAAFADEGRWSVARLAGDARGALATATAAAGDATVVAREALATTGAVAGEVLATAGARTVEAASAARDRLGGLLRRS